ncbi:hypothetical protein SAMN06269185_0234 [Natronoarchaeum philippinense]|uniref:Uncharacterized protein n=1 Tax=Natronoarchaeum philippinense TaxID=558529 RepID=A0A285N2V3_NATPI|nr:hypothetical protein [Natronoarchaeum philippinense]SNZ03273.1 hypothetical protein SAMN06269185_0234 [Natronoarchaeum philippinense]
MRQSSYRYLGLLDLVLVAALVGVFGPAALTTSVGVPAMAVAGMLALLAGVVAELSVGTVTVTWRHLIGASYALFAVAVPAVYAPVVLTGSAGGEELLLFVVSTIGGLSLLFYGVDVARGGRHFEVESNVERSIGV